MNRKPITVNPAEFPSIFSSLLTGAPVSDSSCSPQARVYYIDRDGGYFLKRSPGGTLKKEASMAAYFHEKSLGPPVLSYITDEGTGEDWLLTARLPGEDGIFPGHLSDPARLCDLLSESLTMLHSLPTDGCPVPNRTAEYLRCAEEGYHTGRFDLSYGWPSPFPSAEDAWRTLSEGRHLLGTDTLIHGDYCLPNILFRDGKLSGFIDVGNGGIGDRHVDLYWGVWTLIYNLKTNRYTDRFLDGYGRSRVSTDMLRIVSAAEVFG